MRRQPDAGGLLDDRPVPREFRHDRADGGARQPQLAAGQERLFRRADRGGHAPMPASERLERGRLQPVPLRSRKSAETELCRHGHDGGAFEQRGCFVRSQVPIGGKARQVQPVAGRIEQRGERLIVGVLLHRLDVGQPGRLGAAARRGENVDRPPAADGALGRLIAHDQSIAAHGADRPLEDQLNQARLAGRNARPFQHGDAAGHVGGAQVHVHRRPVGEGALLAVEHAQPGVDL
ncbi:MAG TPA: hypothetical protein VEM36_15325 [Xanthobacteraceae bacterium]|nr:hypothetical protein [Xanthobacteraceae bacterium]